jgi:hypothetical protein
LTIDKNLTVLFKANNIDVLTIGAHSSHICQPLDVGINSIFKKKIFQLYNSKNDRENKNSFKNQVVDTIQKSTHISLSPSSIKMLSKILELFLSIQKLFWILLRLEMSKRFNIFCKRNEI